MFLEFDKVAYYKTPIGTARIVGDDDGISSIVVIDGTQETSENIPECLQDCVTQLDEYFHKDRKSFNLKLNPQGTEFQKTVWEELQQIPYAKTETYLAQSKRMGDVKAIRAIAAANGKNPICIVVPCHRVMGSDGSLTGYSGGIWRKRWLLEHENPPTQQSLF
tara:strand:+ start:64939 stop:65427 length:489 start_codon:yes stop_codon:yes gene_type:complete